MTRTIATRRLSSAKAPAIEDEPLPRAESTRGKYGVSLPDLSALSYDDLVVLGHQVGADSKWALGDMASQELYSKASVMIL